MKHNLIDRETLYNYYITENHTFSETLKKFNLTNYSFYKLLNKYNIKKPSSNDFKKLYSKEVIYKYYILENHSFAATVNHFKTTRDILAQVLREYKINKTEIYTKTRAAHLNNITKEDFINYYITENHTIEDTCKFFNIFQSELVKLTRKYKVRKSSEPLFDYISDEYLFKKVSKEHLIDKYINNNLSKKQVSEYFNICDNNVDKLLRKYVINKPNELKNKLAAASKLKNTGTLGNPEQFNSYSDEFKNLFYDYDKSKEFLDVQPRYKARDLTERFNCNSTTIFYWVKRLNLRDYIVDEKSHYENEIAEYLRQLIPNIEIKIKDRKALNNNLELDIYLPAYKLGIEFNGTYWHSDAVISDKKYHLKKSMQAESLGIHLLHIYEYEWLDENKQRLIKSLIQLFLNIIPNKIHARKCEVKQITNKEAREFNDKNHLQRHRNAQITYGLFYNNELVQLMSFSKTKYNRNLKTDDSWEIIRGCPGSLNIVVGGVSKLFTRFVRDYEPDSVFSYCDFNKFRGTSYEKLGMKFIGYTGPDKKYVINNQVCNRKPHKYKEYKNLIQYSIFGAGSKKYLWENIYKQH